MPKLERPPRVSDFVGNEERKQWIGSHPRLTYLGRNYALSCDAGAGPLVGTGRGTRHKRGCKNKAQFKFVALAKSDAVSGLYCWTHLTMQIGDEPTGREKKAFDRWAAKHEPPWQDRWEEWAKQADLEPKEPE